MLEVPKIDIRPDHWEIVRGILQKHVPQHEVWAFGSRAKWTAKEYSDLDLAVITDKPLLLDVSANLSDDFSESDLPYKVDLVDWATTGESFRKIIEKDKVVVQGARRRGVMASDHPVVRLGDYVDTCLGKMLDAQKNRGELHPYLGNSNVRWGSFDLEELSVMRFEDHEEERYSIRDGDLIVCEGGEPGRCAIWRGNAPMKIQKALHRVRTKTGLDKYFLYYWFLRAGSTGTLEPFFTGTTIKHLTGKALAELRIPLPPIKLQCEVAKVLRSLDSKIEINRRINQTLEAMAQAIFKSWFVDFDPVKAKIAAKQEGRDPLLAAMSAISGKPEAELDALPSEQYEQLSATAALFPDEMEESELGEIPKGWQHSTIGAEVTVCGGATPNTKEPEFWNGGKHCWATPKDLSTLKFPVLLDTKRKITDAGLAKISSGLLPAGTVLLSSRAPIGYLAIAEISTAINQGFIAMKCDGVLPNVFVLQWCRKSMDAIVSNANGSTFQEINKSNFRPISVVVPSEPVLATFKKSAELLYQQLRENERQSRTLANLRDTLLPKLLSGELSIENLSLESEITV